MIPNFSFYAGASCEYFGVMFGAGPWMRTIEPNTGFGRQRFAAGVSEWEPFGE